MKNRQKTKNGAAQKMIGSKDCMAGIRGVWTTC